jgi:mediator of RNA polymerase II transcription subunit 17, fungi type
LNSRILRFTFATPATLIAHLPKATLKLISISQLRQVICDEVEEVLLEKCCRLGKSWTSVSDSSWFVDVLARQTIMQYRGITLLVFPSI